MGDLLIWQVLLSRNAIHSEVKMTTDEGTPGTEPQETPGTEPQDEEGVSKFLLMQVKIVGGIVFLILLAIFFGAI